MPYCLAICVQCTEGCEQNLWVALLGRPTKLSADSFFLSFFRQLPAELAEGNSTTFGHMVRSKCYLKSMSEIWDIPSPYKAGAQNHFFRRLCNLTATLTAYVFGTKHGIHKRARALQSTRGSYIVSKRRELWSTNGFKLEVSFHAPSVNSAFHFIARLRIQRSANGSQPNFAQRWTVSCEKLGSSLPNSLWKGRRHLRWNKRW